MNYLKINQHMIQLKKQWILNINTNIQVQIHNQKNYYLKLINKIQNKIQSIQEWLIIWNKNMMIHA